MSNFLWGVQQITWVETRNANWVEVFLNFLAAADHSMTDRLPQNSGNWRSAAPKLNARRSNSRVQLTDYEIQSMGYFDTWISFFRKTHTKLRYEKYIFSLQKRGLGLYSYMKKYWNKLIFLDAAKVKLWLRPKKRRNQHFNFLLLFIGPLYNFSCDETSKLTK